MEICMVNKDDGVEVDSPPKSFFIQKINRAITVNSLLHNSQVEEIKLLFNELKMVLENLFHYYDPVININSFKQYTYITCFFVKNVKKVTYKDKIESSYLRNENLELLYDDNKNNYVTYRIIYSSFIRNKLYFQSNICPIGLNISYSKDILIPFDKIDLENGSSKRKHINLFINIFRSHIQKDTEDKST